MFVSEKGLRHTIERSWPISPLSMSAFAFVYGAYQFRWAAMARMVPARRQASIIASASSSVRDIGFVA